MTTQAQDTVVLETPSKLWGAEESTSNARTDQRERLPQSFHKDRPVALHHPSSPRRRSDSHGGPQPLEHCLHPAHPNNEGVKQFQMHDKPCIDDKVSGACDNPDANVILNFRLGPPIDSSGHGIFHKGNTKYDTRDGFRVH